MQTVVDKITRSARKTMSLEVTRDGKVIVRAPNSVSAKAIEKFVEKHSQWIIRKKALVAEKLKRHVAKTFADGESYYFLGQTYKLIITEDPDLIFEFDKAFYLSRSHIPKARSLFTRWYANQAKTIIADRVKHYSSITGIRRNWLTITNAQTRWGSCSHKGNLCFSWRLIMAPLEIIDYVVVHELVHVQIKDHSKVFWKKVESIVPDYRARLKWLKENGAMLNL
jgi:predicted metal-dependent hydrolase